MELIISDTSAVGDINLYFITGKRSVETYNGRNVVVKRVDWFAY
ncbi:MAG: hypothetical protein U5K79_19180 [Cyclobacteriaceae bacterium]|nr:hypothetical protein [Cyclobacteriaceae bacterium]